MTNERTPCALILRAASRLDEVEEHANRQVDKTECAFTEMRKGFESFQRWLIGIIVMSVLLSVTGGLWKISDEFKEVREAIHALDKKITNINIIQ